MIYHKYIRNVFRFQSYLSPGYLPPGYLPLKYERLSNCLYQLYKTVNVVYLIYPPRSLKV